MRALMTAAALLAASCAVGGHGRNCSDIEEADREERDTAKVPSLRTIAARRLSPHEQVHLIDAIFNLGFPESKIEVLAPLLVNAAFCAEARARIEERSKDEGERVRLWVRAALGGRQSVPGWRGMQVEQTPKGVRVVLVAAGSPSAAAGVQVGDVIVALGERAIAEVAVLEEAGRTLDVRGEAAQLDVLRGESRRRLTLAP